MRAWQTVDVPEIGAPGISFVTLEQARYAITPEQAIWIPTGTRHTTTAFSDVEFRALYIEDAPNIGMSSDYIALAALTAPDLREAVSFESRCHGRLLG